jgi:hypothetical protein
MARILPFRPDTQASTRKSQSLDSQILNVVPINRNVVANRGSKAVALRFPEAWLPFVRWPIATSTNR